MKTFDEAIQVAVLEPSPDAVERLQVTIDRYGSIIAEAMQNEAVAGMIQNGIAELRRGGDLASALFTAFAIGLATGIEMEKME